MELFCGVCDETTEWINVHDKAYDGLLCKICYENYISNSTAYQMPDLKMLSVMCLYNGEFFVCQNCGNKRPYDKTNKNDKKQYWVNAEGVALCVCDKCIGSKKKKWSIGWLLFVILLLVLALYIVYYFN
jgi:hypothetical protein